MVWESYNYILSIKQCRIYWFKNHFKCRYASLHYRWLKPTLNHCGIQGRCRDSRHQENKNMMTQDELDVWVNELLEQNNDS